MDDNVKELLMDLRNAREKVDTKHMTNKGAVALFNVQTAITGILQEELLEMKIEQAKDQKTRLGNFDV